MNDAELKMISAIRRIVHAVDRHSKQVEREAGVTLPQLVVLSAIRALGEVTTGHLSSAASLSPATVTTILDKLETRGWVRRYRNAEDRRVVHSQLTAQGEAKLASAPPWLHERFVTRFAALDPARQAEILRAFEAVADMMGAPALESPAGDAVVPIESELAAAPAAR